jgi:ankyrin repeat protein
MSLAPKHVERRLLSYFGGSETANLPLIEAVYFDNFDRARAIVGNDPEQLNTQDPFAGLTPLHIAIFRQNADMVDLIASHPRTDMHLRDNFQRRPIDMCIYVSQQAIFDLIVRRTYPGVIQSLSDPDGSGPVTPFPTRRR